MSNRAKLELRRLQKETLGLSDQYSVMLSDIEFTRDEMYNQLGMQIDRCINYKFHNDFGTVKLTESLPIEAYKNLFYNEKSEYYTKENSVSGFDVYQAYTDIICNGKSKDLANRFEKTLMVGQILGI